MSLTGVAEVAVLGVPDDVYGEVVTALVARRCGMCCTAPSFFIG